MVQGYVKGARWHDENGWNEEKNHQGNKGKDG